VRGPTRAKRAAPSQASSHAATMPAKSGAERVFDFAEMGGGGIKRSDGRWNPAYGQAPRLLAMHERSEVRIRGLLELPCDSSIRQESCKSHGGLVILSLRSRTCCCHCIMTLDANVRVTVPVAGPGILPVARHLAA
jgi:hypothetical protein